MAPAGPAPSDEGIAVVLAESWPPRWWVSQLSGKSPLVRSSERKLARLAVALTAVALLAIPVVAAVGSTLVAQEVERSERRAMAVSQVSAVLLEDASQSSGRTVNGLMEGSVPAQVPASWRLPNGAQRHGLVSVGPGAAAGTAIDIWVDQTGAKVRPPLTVEQAAASGVAQAVAIWLAFALGLAGIYWIARIKCGRVSSADWDAEWRRVQGDWSTQ